MLVWQRDAVQPVLRDRRLGQSGLWGELLNDTPRPSSASIERPAEDGAKRRPQAGGGRRPPLMS